MTTSRTGTASHKRFRRDVLRAGQQAGITHCPLCNVMLDYDEGRKPNSAEPDHIVPHALGGYDHVDNGRVICRRCNQRRGDKMDAAPTGRITNLIAW